MAVLMISSQLMLTAFVLYWLMTQFREQRTLLHGQLTQEYLLVHDRLVDSMLMKHLVIPSLNDTVMVKLHEQLTIEDAEWSDSASGRVIFREHPGELPEEIQMSAIHVDATATPDTGMRSIDITSMITSEERMVRSIKLFINKNPEAFRNDTGIFIQDIKLDSCTLMLHMKRALEEREWTFSLDWPQEAQEIEEPEKEELARMNGMWLYGESRNSLPSLHVEHFNAYLVRAIFPQILFALILLVLSGSALLFAYRSLLRQLALNRLRDDFIGNISHELKTPVSTVKIALEALHSFDRQKDTKLRGEYLEMAVSELERLERLVAKVLHHQMLNNPSLVLEKENCNLGDLARSVVRTLEIPIREKGARVRVSEEKGPCMVKADRVYVEGMILNLIDNSLKYTPADPEIHIRIDCSSRGTILSVSDNGPGIPEEYRDQVFEKFFRIPSGNKHNVKGYGLGLNFASQVMIQHGGTISFNNLPEGGCCFTLHFPATDP